jgi:hypothetical protein
MPKKKEIEEEVTTEAVVDTTATEEETGPHRPRLDELVEGPVIGIDKAAIYIDLAPYGTGIIYGREYIAARDLIKKTNIKVLFISESGDSFLAISL